MYEKVRWERHFTFGELSFDLDEFSILAEWAVESILVKIQIFPPMLDMPAKEERRRLCVIVPRIPSAVTMAIKAGDDQDVVNTVGNRKEIIQPCSRGSFLDISFRADKLDRHKSDKKSNHGAFQNLHGISTG